MPFIIPQILVQDPCCKFHDCLKILNQKYVEAKCDGCLEVDYAQEKRDLDRYRPLCCKWNGKWMLLEYYRR